jgi:DnaJ-domain-containing protein 1
MPDCAGVGEYRAPKSRNQLNEYWWFCLAHVRAYNSAWDYCRGMSPVELESMMRADTTWGRPSWPLGHFGFVANRMESVLDSFGLDGLGRQPRREAPVEATPPELREPLAVFDLPWPTSLDAVKARYKELAKRHHPDVAGEDAATAEQIKSVNVAYAALTRHFRG